MRKLVSILLGLAIFASVNVNAQSYYTAGSDPKTNWKSIYTEHYEIIFPSAIDSLARVYAANMEAVRKDAILLPQHVDPKRTPVILHPYTLTGNDNQRSHSPLRLDVYTSPKMYEFMSEPWEYTTAIAKSRHLGQAYLMDRGFFRYARYIFGDNARLLGDALFFNRFYWLGDARVAVTDLSHAGVGRSADFLKTYRTAFAQNDNRSYYRWKLGSYEYYTPEPEKLGYLLEANYRDQNNLSDFSWKWADAYFRHPLKGWVLGSLSDETSTFKGKYFDERWKQIGDYYREDYASRKPFTPESKLWPAENYNEYLKSSYDKENNVLYAVKSSLKETDHLVEIDLKYGTERKLMTFSTESSDVTLHGDLLYWSETVHKGPWELRDYSELFTYNIRTGAVRRITSNTRYYNPVPNGSGTVLAVSENTVDGKSYLTILSPSGDKEASFPAPDNGSIKELVWIGDVLYCLIVTADGLGVYSMGDDGWSTAIAPQWQNISDMGASEIRLNGRMMEVLTFTSDVDGVSNIYAYVPRNHTVYRLINSPYGAACANGFLDGGLIYSSYGRNGYSIVSTAAEDFELKVVDMSSPHSFPLADKGTELASNAYPKPDEALLASYQDESRYPSEEYSKVAHLFHIHSWSPIYREAPAALNGNTARNSIGLMVVSQNMLGTVTGRLGYTFDRSKYTGKYRNGLHAGMSFKGGIPRVDVNAEINTYEKVELVHYINEEGQVANGYRLAADGVPFYDISARIYQPLSYNMLGWYAEVLPYVTFHHNNNRAVDLIGQKSGTTDYFQIGIGAGLETETAYAAIYPRWGLIVTMDRIAPAAFGSAAKQFTSQTALGISAYLPGFEVTHGVKVGLSVVNQNWKKGRAVFLTESLIDMPRGLIKMDPSQFNSRNYIKGAIEYALPVNLGDTDLAGLLYLRRLQLIPFFDFATSWQYSGGRKEFYSMGSEIMLNCNFFGIRQGLILGVRYAYNNGSPSMPGSHTFQVIFKGDL
ncbi:MAG: hypothetical protein IK009_04610 [Bacteroidales bacterium]|nr:hypothetical protein [Bacteroidales bacterium]